MDQYKISVIMPVFNDEKYIREALDSAINQTLKDIEIICVNDGSTDNSLRILNEYKEKYGDKIKIFNQKNQGSGIARNYGMTKAKGEYIAFLDSDDFFIDDDALEKMYAMGNRFDTEMVSANLKVLDTDGNLVINRNLERFTKQKIIKAHEYGIPYSFYKNIFKRTFLLENNFTFPDLLRGQDPVFFAEVLTSVEKIPVVPVELYALRASGNNFGKINTYRKRYDYLNHFKLTIDILKKNNFDNLIKPYEEQLFYYINSPELSFEEKNEIHRILEIILKDDVSLLNRCEEFFEKPKVSLIIPVYNAEKFLDESIGSVLNQTLEDIELVCVNDGSNDNSLEMLKNFARKDSRVKIINQQNGGCGAARNKALDNANGQYIYFFDPDDYMSPYTLEELYNNAISNDSDFVIFKIASFYDGQPINYSSPGFEFERIFKDVDFNNFTFSYKDVKRYVLLSSFAPWTKFYKKEFLDKYDDFRFHTNVAFDDVPFHVQSMLRASKISYVPQFFYYYRLSNPNSVNNTASNAPDILKIINFVEDFLKNNGFYNEFREEFIIFKITQLSLYINSSHSENYFKLVKNNIADLDFYGTDVPESIEKKMNALKYYNAVINSNSIDEYNQNFRNIKLIDSANSQKVKENNNIKENEDINEYIQREISKLENELQKVINNSNDFSNSYYSKDISYFDNLIGINKKLYKENMVLKERIDFLNGKNKYLENKNNKKGFFSRALKKFKLVKLI